MLRLFLSLYLAICLGLIVINFSSKQLFEHLQTDTDINQQADIVLMAQLLKGFAALDEKNRALALSQLPYSYQELSLQQLHLLPEQTEKLANGEVIILYESDTSLALYVHLTDQLAKPDKESDKDLGKVRKKTQKVLAIHNIQLSNQEQPHSTLQQSIIVISYLSLALFVLAWSRPLWRDLSVIKRVSEQIQKGDLNHKVNIRNTSVIYPVIKSFNIMASKIEELLNNQKQMTHAVSHDIRTPLSRIKFSLAILQNQPELLTQNSKDMLDDVAEIDRLTSELLTFAQLESNQTLNKESVDLNQLLQHLSEKLTRNTELQLNISCPENTWFYCDGHLIERVLQNLITNGFKYAKSVVEVTISTNEKHLTIEVHDDGQGIQPEYRQSVLNPFTTADNSRNKNTSGFGLGLAIVSKIVKWHHGTIEIKESHLGGVLVEIGLIQE